MSLPGTSKSELRSSDFSEAEKVAAVGWTLVREVFPLSPTQQRESDLALKLRLKLLAEVVREVGPDRFMAAVEKTIAVSPNRFHCTVARIREMAGLMYQPPRQPAAVAWEQLVQVFVDHVRTDANGNYRPEERVRIVDGETIVTPAPALPEATQRALRSLGGWAAIAEAWPEYIGQKYRDFCSLYEPDSPQKP